MGPWRWISVLAGLACWAGAELDTEAEKYMFLRPKDEYILLTQASSEIKRTPIIIINFNQLFYLQRLVNQLRSMGYHNIIIVDNNSTYPPLITYYQMAPAWVYRMPRNFGNLVFFTSGMVDNFADRRFVMTDPDVVFGPECPDNWLEHFWGLLDRHPVQKVGAAMRIDDIPDWFPFKSKVLDVEAKHWTAPVPGEQDVYKADIDTTMALYREGANNIRLSLWYEATEDALRVAGPYQMRHMLWYEDPATLLDDMLHALRTKEGTWRHGQWSQYVAKHLGVAKTSVDCWTGPFSEEKCCDPSKGPRGDMSCWDEAHTFEACCGKRTQEGGDASLDRQEAVSRGQQQHESADQNGHEESLDESVREQDGINMADYAKSLDEEFMRIAEDEEYDS